MFLVQWFNPYIALHIDVSSSFNFVTMKNNLFRKPLCLFIVVCLLLFTKQIKSQTPTITSFSPTSGSVGTLVTIVGTNLGHSSSFTIGGVNAIVVSDTSILLSNYGDTLVGLVMPGATTGPMAITTTNGNVISNINFVVTTTLYPSGQQRKLVGTGAIGVAGQGQSVSISADGNTAIVGGYGDNNNAGAVWIYTRSGGIWTQQGSKLVGTGAVGAAYQGTSVALSADGNTAIVGGYRDNSGAGAVWIYTRSGGAWAQQGSKLVGTGAIGAAHQGTSVSLSADGNTAIVGGSGDSTYWGAAWVYTRSGGTWSQLGSKLVGTGSVEEPMGGPSQGGAVCISSDGYKCGWQYCHCWRI